MLFDRLFGLGLAVLLLATRAAAEISIKGVSGASGMTQAEQQAMIDEHNALRSRVAQGTVGSHPKAADMTRMAFSQRAAGDAQLQAAECGGPMHGHKQGQGQNFASYSDPGQVLAYAFKFWFDGEQALYSLRGRPNPQAFHFSQIIWAKTTTVGCGAKNCGRNTRVVCNYIPQGNYNGNPAYQEGEPCSKCPSSHPKCAESLCSTEADCAKPQLKGKCKDATVDPSGGKQGGSTNSGGGKGPQPPNRGGPPPSNRGGPPSPNRGFPQPPNRGGPPPNRGGPPPPPTRNNNNGRRPGGNENRWNRNQNRNRMPNQNRNRWNRNQNRNRMPNQNGNTWNPNQNMNRMPNQNRFQRPNMNRFQRFGPRNFSNKQPKKEDD